MCDFDAKNDFMMTLYDSQGQQMQSLVKSSKVFTIDPHSRKVFTKFQIFDLFNIINVGSQFWSEFDAKIDFS